ncbi:MAG: plastocyanin/azurin family copper-binding protein [Solirubrobacterales bacterium]
MRVRIVLLAAALLVASLLGASFVTAQEPDPSPEATDGQATGADQAEPETTDADQPTGPAPDDEPAAGDQEQPSTAEASVEPAAPQPAAKSGSGVTIRDFEFDPSAITVSVGDTISWTNEGQTDHTATATGGEFDTGILSDGESASHTFSTAGTFQYICTPHPFMKGTVTVTSGGSSTPNDSGDDDPGDGTGPITEAAAGQSPDAAGTSSSLPMTGLPLLPLWLAGLILAGAGVALRGRARRAP